MKTRILLSLILASSLSNCQQLLKEDNHLEAAIQDPLNIDHAEQVDDLSGEERKNIDVRSDNMVEHGGWKWRTKRNQTYTY